MSIEQFNKTNFVYDTSKFKFKKLSDLKEDEIYTIRGIYINEKSHYGAHPYVATDKFFVDLPKHLLGTCKLMLQDTVLLADINAGKCGFQLKPYEKDGNKYYSVTWIDIAI